MRRKSVLCLWATLFLFIGISGTAYANRLYSATVPFFSDGLDLEIGTVQRDPTVLIVMFGPQDEIAQVLKPAIENFSDFSPYPEIDLHFEYVPELENPFLLIPGYQMEIAAIGDVSFGAVNFSDLDGLGFQTVGAGESLVLDPDDILVFKTTSLDFWVMEILPNGGINPLDINVKHLAVPEPSSLVLISLGVLCLLGIVSWRKNMKHTMMFLVLAAGVGITNVAAQTGDESKNEIIYTSQNLAGHEIFAECNPGGATNCPCSGDDVSLGVYESYGEVISNAREINTYVNAIGYKKFTETFPNGSAIALGTYKYTAHVRLPILPAPDINQTENPQAIHTMIQLWDGRNALFQSNQTSLEGAIYWDLNPWSSPEGKIKVYTNNPGNNELELFDTRLSLLPDTDWHTFELVVDFVNQRYVSVTIDDETKDLSTVALAKVHHPDWGEDVSLVITTESMAASPQADCTPVFTWTTQFKDLEFHHVYDETELDCLTVRKGGSGTGTVWVGERECGSDCTKLSLAACPEVPTALILKALPDADSYFVRWESEDGNPLHENMLSVSQPGATVIAVFEKK